MSKKNKKNKKPTPTPTHKKPTPTHDQPTPTHDREVNQNFHKKTIAIPVIVTGAVLALWFAFAPESWWQPGNVEISAAKHNMIGLVAASLTLSTLILTSNNSENTYKALLYFVTGGVAWLAAFFALEVKTLKVAFWMSLCLLPLLISMSGLYVQKPTKNNAPALFFFVGIAMVVMVFVFSSTKAGLLVLSVLITVLGELLDVELIIELASVFMALIGVFGIVLILIILGYGWVKSQGDAQSKS